MTFVLNCVIFFYLLKGDTVKQRDPVIMSNRVDNHLHHFWYLCISCSSSRRPLHFGWLCCKLLLAFQTPLLVFRCTSPPLVRSVTSCLPISPEDLPAQVFLPPPTSPIAQYSCGDDCRDVEHSSWSQLTHVADIPASNFMYFGYPMNVHNCSGNIRRERSDNINL